MEKRDSPEDLSAFVWSLYKACKLTPKTPETSLWSVLKSAYSEPPRFYHTIEHALSCVVMGAQMMLPSIGIMALLYHDAHYVAGSTINEEESVSLLREHYGDWRDEFVGKPLPHPSGPSPLDKIGQLILATKHLREPRDSLEAAVMDIDMSILGAEQAEFDDYEKAIRLEYAYMPDEVYNQGRSHFLGGLLSRKQIYYNQLLHHGFEAKARNNITRLIFILNNEKLNQLP
jgi:predicted metal-dependent HD superfamily phosphohydrolase